MYGYNLGLAKAKVSESIPAAPSNVVLPSLVGNGAVGTIVTCSPGAWIGSPSPTFTYNFKLDTISVQSGSSNTYTPLIGDDTKTLTCTVTATNTEGSANADTSNSLVIGIAPSNSVAPVISGTNTFGSTLTTTNGTFTGTAPLTYTYQWLRGGSPISGETAQTYVIGASDSLAAITCEVKATNTYGFDSEVSNTITVQDFAPINTVAPTVSPSGTQVTGTLITANVGTWTGVAPITYEYKWTRNGVAISGATASTYTIQVADDLATIRVEVKGTNAYGVSAYIASSNSVNAVNSIVPTITSATISGTAVVGQTLTASANGVTGYPTPTLSYQWKRGATNIGTNASTYTLVQADAGNTSNITCVVTATNAGGSANATSNQIAQILTVRTNSFLTASAISDTTIRGALNTLDVGLISNSLDTKMKALYPFVGGTATTHKWNFMDARDLDAAFRLTFTGTATHNSNGYTPNGTNAYADTFLNISLQTNWISSNHLSYYSRTQTPSGSGWNMGVGNASTGAPLFGLAAIRSGNMAIYDSGNYPNERAEITQTNGLGLWLGSCTASNSRKLYRNGTTLINNTLSGTAAASNAAITLGALRNTAASTFFYMSQNMAFASIGNGLTDTDATNYYTLVQAFQTALGRNV